LSILGISTSKNEKQVRKTIWAFLILSAAAVAVDRVYGIFSHGVDSAAMTWMFLYPLLGGALFFFIIDRLFPHITNFAGYRLFLNIHNSGIATLTLASLLKGVFEIAGTNSPLLVYYYVIGWVFIAAGLIIMLMMATNKMVS
jgi:hypothetical protein